VETINKKRQVDEITRCARDPLYFFNTYVKVSHPTKGPVPFKTFGFQDDCVKAFIENRFVIVNKSRQLGLSTLSAAYAAWLLIFHKNKEIIIMATKLKVAMNFIRKVKFCVQSLPKWLVLPKIAEDNKQSLVFGAPSNSRIEAIPTAADAGRSEALSLLIVDEAAHVSDFEELWKGLYPTLSTGGRAIIISTPKGVGNWFHKLWVDAQDKVNEFYPIELPWQVHP
jgi:phage FluMu gp28-like protein